ncbi:MAG: fluoride efflux transporter CrcB [Thermodesulfobacteriota bacterium]
MKKIFLVMMGGSLGALCRYGVSLLAVKLCGNSFPWGTLLANLSGCFLIGTFFALGERNIMDPSARLFFITGFLGALTTFSAFALETMNAMYGGSNVIAGQNFLFNNIGGMVMVFVGMWLGRML